MNSGIATFITYILIAGIAWAITGLVRKYALKKSVLDVPNHRSLHANPTPRGGGLAIVIPVLAMTLLLWRLDLLQARPALAILTGGAAVAAVGWIDDIRGLPARWRFLFYIGASGWAAWCLLPPAERTILVWLGWTLAIGWLTNLYNFMDGSDALAGSQGLFAAGIAALLLGAGQPGIAILLAVLAASCTGFLIWNWPPARIFMGDTGSCFTGYLFGVGILLTHIERTLSPAVWLILLAVFIVDASLTLIKRILNGETWYAAHRSHAYQLLVQAGMSHRGLVNRVWLGYLGVLLPLAWLAFHYGRFAWLFTGLTYILAAGLWLLIQLRNKPETNKPE